MSKILVTGGAGYIGSHTVVSLVENGYEPILVDNFSNSSPKAIERIEQIVGRRLSVYNQDLRDQAALDRVFQKEQVDAVIHFAGLKAVGESVRVPLNYYNNNLISTLSLLEVMGRYGCKKLVFSSSATVYGNAQKMPLDETAPLSVTNPYGRTKLMIEDMLRDLAAGDLISGTNSAPAWNIIMLRYFNPVGAHESGMIGEDPLGIPNNLFPYICRVAVGRLKELSIFGGDYPTCDGTGVRDYVHVSDLAEGHVAALRYLFSASGEAPFADAVNLGTGSGISVLEALKAFESASGRPVPHKIIARRPGDVAECYSDPSKANRLFGWSAKRSLAQMCADAWRWQAANPSGYS